MTGQKFDRFTS